MLHTFEGTDGGDPYAGLIRATDGNFYGTTSTCGAHGGGTVFKITPGGNLTTVYSFCSQSSCGDGAESDAGLIQASDGNFYGTTYVGGAHSVGTLFQVTPQGTLTTLHSFNGGDGAGPLDALVQASDGSFYGTTYTGGSSGYGTVFKLALTYDTLTVTTSGQGSVTSTDGIINCPGTCSHDYLKNTQVTLNATPATGWAFTGWGGACSGTGACNVTMSQNQNVSATFTQLPVTLTVSVAGSGTVTSTDGFIHCPGTCTHTYDPGTPVTLNAAAASGWYFAGWTGACTGVGACNLTMTDNLAVTGVFIEPGHGLAFTAVTPCRLVDTRTQNGGGGPIQGGTFQNFDLPQLAQSKGCGDLSSRSGRLFAERDGGAARAAGLYHHLADGRGAANGLDHELARRAHQGQRGHRAGRNQQRSQRVCQQHHRCGAGHRRLLRAGSGGSSLQFYPLTPCRVLDTRNPDGPLGGPYLKTGEERDFPVLSSDCNIPDTRRRPTR